LRSPQAVFISLISLAVTGLAAFALPLMWPAGGMEPIPAVSWAPIVFGTAMIVVLSQSWRVAIRGARGDVSISMAVDVATMLLLHPFIAASGSALGTALYHLFFARAWREHRTARAVVRGIVTFSAVALGGWLFHTLRPMPGPLNFVRDWIAIGVGIGLRLLIRVVFYPLGMAALRTEPVWEQLKYEWERLPVVPFLLTTTLGGSAAVIWQAQPAAIVLLLGPLAATWAATVEFSRLNELLATLEDKVADRTARLAETVKDRERRLAEFEAIGSVSQAMVQAIHPEQVLDVIARETVRVTGATSALVTLPTEDGSRQFVRAACGDEMLPYVGFELPIAGNLAGLVIRTGDVQVSVDPPNDPRLNQELVKVGHWQHVIEAPLLAKGRVLGVLVAATGKPVGFDEQHIRLLSLFANQAGLFLENAHLHEKDRAVAILEERNRLARELHDSVTQLLFGLTLNLEAAAGVLETKPVKAAVLVTRSQEMASEALAEMRSLIFELRPAALQEKGLAAALANHINLFRRRQSIEVTLTLEEGEERLAPEIEFCIYRVAQESLNNVAKHARARHVLVTYSVEREEAVLEVEDDGVGFVPDTEAGAQSFGMTGMRERLVAHGGSLEVLSAPGQGTRIEARIPLNNHSREG
jgi:signal transduction histidine kinase